MFHIRSKAEFVTVLPGQQKMQTNAVLSEVVRIRLRSDFMEAACFQNCTLSEHNVR